jgi:hypothetical protein
MTLFTAAKLVCITPFIIIPRKMMQLILSVVASSMFTISFDETENKEQLKEQLEQPSKLHFAKE